MADVPTILHRLDHERRHLVRRGDVIENLPRITRLHGADGSHHEVIYASLTAETADSAIAQEIEFHRDLGVGFEWKVYSYDEPADLRDRLGRHGLHIGSCEAVLVFDLNSLNRWSNAPASHRVERVDRVEQVAEYRQAAAAIFGKDYAFTAMQLAEAIRAESMEHRGYIAYAGAEPVSVGRLYTHHESWFGGLYGGGTLGQFRGMGYYRSVVAARARDAVRLGARYLIVDALPTSRPILERLGFEWVADTWPCEWAG